MKSPIDKFLIGKHKLIKYVVDTTRTRYIDTNFYEDEYLKILCKEIFSLDINNRFVTVSGFPQFFKSLIHTKIDNYILTCSGASMRKDEALSKSIGELLERVSAYKPWSGTHGTYITTHSLTRRFSKKKYSAQEIYWGIRGAERFINGVHVTSNGCGGGFSREMAIVAGWLEAVERDSFMVHWLNTFSPKRLDIKSYIERLKNSVELSTSETDVLKLYTKLEQYKITPHVLDTTTDLGVPALAVALEVTNLESGEKEYSVGASAGYDVSRCVMSATLEALTVLRRMPSQETYILPKPYVPFSDASINIDRRTHIYKTHENNVHFDFFISSKDSTPVESWSSSRGEMAEIAVLQKITETFREWSERTGGGDAYLHTFTNGVLKELNYHVVRVLCPGLYPIYLNENFANTSHPRLAQFARAIGKEKESKLNIWPHPFP